MKRTGETHRLTEDHLIHGLEGKLIKGEAVPFWELCIFEFMRPRDGDYPIRVEVSGPKHTGTYAMATPADAIKLMVKVACLTTPVMTEELINTGGSVTITSHKGTFTFIIQTQKLGD